MKSKVYYGEFSLKHWIDLILKKNLKLPKYQRHFVWDEQRTLKLVEAPAEVGECRCFEA